MKTQNFTQQEWQLLEKYSPCLSFDENEIFFPKRVGVSIIYQKTHPPSLIDFYSRCPSHTKIFKYFENFFLVIIYDKPPFTYKWVRDRFQPILMSIRRGSKHIYATKVLEYAIYYDADIQHIYDLEHVWIYLDANDKIIGIKGTRHGMFVTQYESPDQIKYYKNHPLLFCSPGKHAHYTSPAQLNTKVLTHVNGPKVGSVGMYPIQFLNKDAWKQILPHFQGKDYMIKQYQKKYARTPKFHYNHFIIPDGDLLIPWFQLEEEIPQHVIGFLNQL